MSQPRTQFLRAAAVLGVLALAAVPVRADRVTYSLSDVPPDQAGPAGSLTFADFAPFHSSADGGKMVDPAHVYFSPRSMTRETGFARTHDGAFPLTPGQTRRDHLSFYTPAIAPDHLPGAFLGMAYPAGGGPGDVFLVREKLRPLRISTLGNGDPVQKDFPDPVGMVQVAQEPAIEARDGQSALGGAIQRLSQAPEPPTLTLLTLGAVGLLGAYWRQRCMEPS